MADRNATVRLCIFWYQGQYSNGEWYNYFTPMATTPCEGDYKKPNGDELVAYRIIEMVQGEGLE